MFLQVALDAEERAVAREAVVRTTDEADPEQLSLRIRCGSLWRPLLQHPL